MSDIKTYPVCFTGQLKTVECDAAFQKGQAETFKHYIRFARQNKATTLITCQCMKDGEVENRRRLKACYSSTHDITGWLAGPTVVQNTHRDAGSKSQTAGVTLIPVFTKGIADVLRNVPWPSALLQPRNFTQLPIIVMP
ncbi:hypothetical protein [Klebsiella pneumoniae]|uniref:hypothetical protein n=1 Tax=Klebsiella pneumoniae TaxID=573 RepID=UPI0007CC64F9|nr:hypothetical protein [Klebsiella pneumoniae]SAV14619.1 Uncharacterised protein [Klebsiella pneumoniae]